jgi:hypothetical protein
MNTTPALLAILPFLVACGPAFEAATGGPQPDSGGDTPATEASSQDAPTVGQDGAAEGGAEASTDSGTPEASAKDSGSAQDSGSPLGPCNASTANARTCTGTGSDQPMICSEVTTGNFQWVTNGGVCNYGCTTNPYPCACSAPGRFTFVSNPSGNNKTFKDNVSGLTWCASALASAASYCPGWTPQNLTTVETLLIQQPPIVMPNNACGGNNTDSTITSLWGNGTVETSDPCALPDGGVGVEITSDSYGENPSCGLGSLTYFLGAK